MDILTRTYLEKQESSDEGNTTSDTGEDEKPEEAFEESMYICYSPLIIQNIGHSIPVCSSVCQQTLDLCIFCCFDKQVALVSVFCVFVSVSCFHNNSTVWQYMFSEELKFEWFRWF